MMLYRQKKTLVYTIKSNPRPLPFVSLLLPKFQRQYFLRAEYESKFHNWEYIRSQVTSVYESLVRSFTSCKWFQVKNKTEQKPSSVYRNISTLRTNKKNLSPLDVNNATYLIYLIRYHRMNKKASFKFYAFIHMWHEVWEEKNGRTYDWKREASSIIKTTLHLNNNISSWCSRLLNAIHSASAAIFELDRRRRLIPVGFVAVTAPLVLNHFIIGRLRACQCARWRAEEVRRIAIQSERKSIHHIHLLILKGYKMAVPTCKNRLTGADVEESLCNAASRPETTVVQCNNHACPPK